MLRFFFRVFRWGFLGLFFGIGSFNLIASDLETLLVDSPFIPPSKVSVKNSSAEDEPKNPLQDQFEFRGLFEWGGNYSFSIYDRSEKRSHWLGLEEAWENTDFRVTSFDAQTQRILVQLGEQEAFLKLIDSKNRGFLNPRGNLAGQPFPRNAPPPPPQLRPPLEPPPPPPMSSPPSGPPPPIPPEVLERFQKMKANIPQMEQDFLAAGVSGAPPNPAEGGISGLPALRPTNGNSEEGGSGEANNPSSGEIQIPNLPGFDPGKGPPTGPPNIEIPDIPALPED